MAEVRTAPEHATLLCAFANTIDVEDATDVLAEPADLTTWLREHQWDGTALLTGQGRTDTRQAAAADLDLAVRLRSGIRHAMTGHHDRTPEPLPELDELTAELPLRVWFTGATPRLGPAVGGVRGGLARILVAIVAAEADGSWQRLKLCPADDCRWAFYDGSKNRSRHWCSMGVCGNRQKTRTYRARQRGLPTG